MIKGCMTCKYGDVPVDDYPCNDCWDLEYFPKWEAKEE